jgi:polyketide cyclase/dehydrase/lipid transport protein
MAAWHEQAVIDAPVDTVWELVGDPSRYPEWASNVVAVTGMPELDETNTVEIVTQMPLEGRSATIFAVERSEDLREIRLRCQTSGYYSRWVLTEAQHATFLDVEIGVEPTAPQYRLYFGVLGKRYFRRVAQQSLDGIRRCACPAD